MALVFPLNPATNDTYQSGSSAKYLYNGTYWVTDVAPIATVITATSASFAINSLSASFAASSSVAVSSSFATSASFATTASYAITAGKLISSAIIIAGSTSNPTKGTTTVDGIILTDDGAGLCTVVMNYYQSTAGSAGSGDYLFSLPGGYQFDTSFHSAYAATGDPGLSGNEAWIPGARGKVTAGASNLMVSAHAQVWDATRFRILMGSEYLYSSNASVRYPVGSGFFSMGGVGTGFQVSFTFKKA